MTLHGHVFNGFDNVYVQDQQITLSTMGMVINFTLIIFSKYSWEHQEVST